MNDVLLSIICPIYNKEAFLKNCLDSIINACEENKSEIILVDDGSKDQSGIIADEYKLKYNNVKVFHTKNKGVSAARNLGMEMATGNYVTFVDADDEVIEGSFTKAFTYMDKNTDIYICGAIWGNGDKNKCDLYEETVSQIKSKPVFDFFLTGGAASKTIQNSARKYMWGCKEKIYSRKFLIDAGIEFNERLSRNEDVLFSLDCYYNAKIIKFLPINVYINLMDPNGLTSSMNIDKNFNNLEVFFDVFSKRYNNINNKKMALFSFQHTLTLLHQAYLALKKKDISKKKYHVVMKKWFTRNDIRRMLTSMPFNRLSFPKKIAFILTKGKLYYLVGLEMDVYTRLKTKNVAL